MEFRERQVDEVTVIDMAGDLVVTAFPCALQRLVKSILDRGVRRIVLNAAGIARIDSTCLGELLASYTSTVARGGVLKVAAPSADVRRLLELTRLDTVIGAFATESEAIADFAASGNRDGAT